MVDDAEKEYLLSKEKPQEASVNVNNCDAPDSSLVNLNNILHYYNQVYI